MYIWQSPQWPHFDWDDASLTDLLNKVYHERGRLLGRMEGLDSGLQAAAHAKVLTEEIIASSEIAGVSLSREVVRASIHPRPGNREGTTSPPDGSGTADGIVKIYVDTAQNSASPLTRERLLEWQAALFPASRNVVHESHTSSWRSAPMDPAQIVSRESTGRKTIRYEAPPAHRLDREINRFLAWYNGKHPGQLLIHAGLAHLWFVTIHPFEDGNGRIARAILEMTLSRSDKSSHRFFSLSSQIAKERDDYFMILEKTQSGSIDILTYLKWYLESLLRSIGSARELLSDILGRDRFWDRFATENLNDRQIEMMNRLHDGSEGKLTSSSWAVIMDVSQDTAHRDIKDLVQRGILIKNPGGGRSTSYSLVRV